MKLKLWFILSCVFSAISTSTTYSQYTKEDSLVDAIFLSESPYEKIQLMGEVSSLYADPDPEKALEIALQTAEIAISDAGTTFSKNLIGISFLNLEQYDSALHNLQMAHDLAITNQDTTYLIKTLNNIGVVYLNLGKLEHGLEKMNEAADLALSSKKIQQAADAYGNLGGIYVQLGEYEKSREYSKTALDLAIQLGDKHTEAGAYNALGGVEFYLGDYEQGKKFYLEAIELYEGLNDLDGVRIVYVNLGYSYRTQGKNKIAEVYYLKALEYAELVNTADGYRDAYIGLANNNENMGRFEMALDYYKSYNTWRDTIIQKGNMKTLIAMQEKFNSEQTAKENEILLQENRIQDLENKESKAELNQSRIMIISAAVGLVLLIILAVMLLNRNRIKQKANVELQIASDIIQEKNNDITASIEYASKIQEALLPTKDDKTLFTDSFFMLRPKDIVSGDFFWYSKVGNKIVFTAADCTGHGVPGAFMSMIGNTYLHQIVNENKVLQPSVILDDLRENVVKALSQQGEENARKDGMDMAVCVLDTATMELEFAGANNPLYFIHEGEIKEIKGDKQPVGYMPERNGKFTNHKTQLKKGDAIYIFSDGYADQFGGPKGKKFKYKQMRELLHANFEKKMDEQKQIMVDEFDKWKGDLEQIDDVCMIGVRV